MLKKYFLGNIIVKIPSYQMSKRRIPVSVNQETNSFFLQTREQFPKFKNFFPIEGKRRKKCAQAFSLKPGVVFRHKRDKQSRERLMELRILRRPGIWG